MGILEDIGAGISNFGHDAQAAFDQATRNTAQFAGSGFNGSKITGPMAELLGSDPHAFILNLARKQKAGCRQLCIRIAQRNQKSFYALPGNRKITARPPSSANANQIALTLVLAVADSPATASEEAGRMANGLGVKPRGLEGFTVFPIAMPRSQERGLVEGIPAPTPIDAAVLAIAIPIIAAIAAAVLPGLISAATGVIEKVTTPPGDSAEQKAARAEAAKAEQQKSTMTIVAIVGVVILLGGGVIYAVKHKRKAA